MSKIMVLRAGILLAVAALALPALSQSTPPTPTASTNWQNVGSDIPVDPAWRFGTLPNGLRYAIRRNGQPNLISIRIRVGVGALMESDSQQGWTHLLEHMAFRRTANFADGEGVKTWQRLGASFVRDANAVTNLNSTTFMLDLPKSDSEAYKQSLAVLADMMDNAAIDPTDLAAERQVVNAERAQRYTPLSAKMREAQMPLYYAGTKAAVRDVIGTEASLAAASADSLRAYYEAWYRPSNAVVVVVGDADPEALEIGLRNAFSGWKGTGAQPPDPDWGTVRPPPTPAMVVVDPQAPESFAISFVTPHDESPFTLARQQRQFAQTVAQNILRQRLGTAAQKGEAIVNASLTIANQRHGGDRMMIVITPRPGQWKAALDQTYAVLNGASVAPPSQEEIDQQVASIAATLNDRVTNAPRRGSALLATGFIGDFENGDVTVVPEHYRSVFSALRPMLTPGATEATIRELVKPAPRLLVVSQTPVEGGNATVLKALASAQHVTGERSAAIRAVSLDQLVLKGTPATVVSTTPIAQLAAERVQLSNGTELILKRTQFARDRINILVQTGDGLLGQPRDDMGLFWSINALSVAGIGPFTADELGRLRAGRQISFSVAPTFSALTLSGVSNGKDIGDMMKLMTGQLAQPHYSDTSIARLRDSIGSNYRTLFTQPASVMQLFSGPVLRGGDMRFQGQPPLEVVQRLDLPTFQRFWGATLARGPRRVVIVGDFDRDAMVTAVSGTLATLAVPPRPALSAGGDLVRPTPPAAPVILRHQGEPTQVYISWAFPTIGSEDRKQSLALSLAAALVQTRLIEEFREQQGGTYAPSVSHSQSAALVNYGLFIASVQTATTKASAFEAALKGILADLAANGPSDDAFKREKGAALIAMQRSRSDNGWWLNALQDELTPARMEAITGNIETLNWVTADDVKAAVARYLVPAKGFTIQVLPAPVAASK